MSHEQESQQRIARIERLIFLGFFVITLFLYLTRSVEESDWVSWLLVPLFFVLYVTVQLDFMNLAFSVGTSYAGWLAAHYERHRVRYRIVFIALFFIFLILGISLLGKMVPQNPGITVILAIIGTFLGGLLLEKRKKLFCWLRGKND